jgi:DNA mismatch endonuclease (patch repair protein)
MADKISKERRSENMRKIKSKNTLPEITVRKFLFSKGIRFRIHVSTLSGKPDIVLKKYSTVLFIHGCFWHGHINCKYFKLPQTRTDFWKSKIEKNRSNDQINITKLKNLGWNVVEIFECQIREDYLLNIVSNILKRSK